MMKATITLLLLAIALQIFGQPTKEIKRDNEAGWFTETFTVLKSDKAVKHGPYSAYSQSGKLLTTGFYKNNHKDSLWQEFNYKGTLIAAGMYQNDKPTGVWSYMDRNGNPENTFNYSTGELMFHKAEPTDPVEMWIIKDGEKKLTQLERVPIFLPGNEIRLRPLLFGMRYPAQAVSRNIGGRVIVGFVIDENGQPKDHHIIRSAEASLDAEALHCVKLIKGDWLPGILNGKPVATEVTQIVSFGAPR